MNYHQPREVEIDGRLRDVQMIDENGIRADGRGPGDIRSITIETGVVPVADGSWDDLGTNRQ